MLRRVLLIASMVLLNACDEEAPDCNPPVEAYCAENGRCDGAETLEDALATVLMDDGVPGLGSEVVLCGDRVRVRLGDGFVGVLYAYDHESGELVGATPYADVEEDDGCPGLNHWGEPVDFECDEGCLLFNDRVEEFLVLTGTCDSELKVAEPFTAACEARVQADDAACTECACADCYPFIAGEAAHDAGALPAYSERACVREHCAEPCAAVLPTR